MRIRKSKDRQYITAKNNFKKLIPIFWADIFDIIRICSIVLTNLVFDTKSLTPWYSSTIAESGVKHNKSSNRKVWRY